MRFVETRRMNIYLNGEDRKWLSSDIRIQEALEDESVTAFDIYNENSLIGFVLLKEWKEGCFFLWNFAIDSNYQNRHYGSKALKELLALLKDRYQARIITTTYTYGNSHAKYIYEKIGFKETKVVQSEDVHEVDMVLELEESI